MMSCSMVLFNLGCFWRLRLPHELYRVGVGKKYRYGNISRYFAAQNNVDFSTPNIDISPKSDSAVGRMYFCSRQSG